MFKTSYYSLIFIMLCSMIVDPTYLILTTKKTSLMLSMYSMKTKDLVESACSNLWHNILSHLFLFPALTWLTFSATFSTPFLSSWVMSPISRALLLLKLLKSCWCAMLWCSWNRGSLQAISSLRITSVNSSRWHTRI